MERLRRPFSRSPSINFCSCVYLYRSSDTRVCTYALGNSRSYFLSSAWYLITQSMSGRYRKKHRKDGDDARSRSYLSSRLSHCMPDEKIMTKSRLLLGSSDTYRRERFLPRKESVVARGKFLRRNSKYTGGEKRGARLCRRRQHNTRPRAHVIP